MSVEYFHFIDVKRLMQQVTPTVTTLGQALPRIQLGGSSSLSHSVTALRLYAYNTYSRHDEPGMAVYKIHINRNL